jgi:hypothetical protein
MLLALYMLLQVERWFPPQTIAGLQFRGHQLVVVDDWTNRNAPTIVQYDSATGVISGGADVKRDRRLPAARVCEILTKRQSPFTTSTPRSRISSCCLAMPRRVCDAGTGGRIPTPQNWEPSGRRDIAPGSGTIPRPRRPGITNKELIVCQPRIRACQYRHGFSHLPGCQTGLSVA